jgi:hypothetical protein
MKGLVKDQVFGLLISTSLIIAALGLPLFVYLAYFANFRTFYHPYVPKSPTSEAEPEPEIAESLESPGFAYESYENYRWARAVRSGKESLREADRMLKENPCLVLQAEKSSEPKTTQEQAPYKRLFVFQIGNN